MKTYEQFLAEKVVFCQKKAEKEGKPIDPIKLLEYVQKVYCPILPNHPLAGAFTATQNLQKKLDFDMLPTDIVWANYVHLMLASFLQNPQARSYSFASMILMAINELLETEKVEHYDPYELRIRAGIITPGLEPVDNTPYGAINGQIML